MTDIPAETGERWAEIAYEAIAPVYDDFTAEYDSEAWLESLLAKLEARGLEAPGSLLDVGCGTGNSFMAMLDRGWGVTGCDISPAMVKRARAKAGGRAELSVADMRKLPIFGEFDLVWALDDAVNYLLNGEELELTLHGLRANLAPDGLLLFDLNTLHAYRGFFAETTVVEKDGRRLVWQGQAGPETPPGSISEARFEVQGPGEGEPVETHLHRQRHFPEEEALGAMEQAGLECLDVFGQGTDGIPLKPLDELTHTKAVYIARRA